MGPSLISAENKVSVRNERCEKGKTVWGTWNCMRKKNRDRGSRQRQGSLVRRAPRHGRQLALFPAHPLQAESRSGHGLLWRLTVFGKECTEQLSVTPCDGEGCCQPRKRMALLWV